MKAPGSCSDSVRLQRLPEETRFRSTGLTHPPACDRGSGSRFEIARSRRLRQDRGRAAGAGGTSGFRSCGLHRAPCSPTRRWQPSRSSARRTSRNGTTPSGYAETRSCCCADPDHTAHRRLDTLLIRCLPSGLPGQRRAAFASCHLPEPLLVRFFGGARQGSPRSFVDRLSPYPGDLPPGF